MSTHPNQDFGKDEIYIWCGVSRAAIYFPQHIVDTARMITIILDNDELHAVNPKCEELLNMGTHCFSTTRLCFDVDLDLNQLITAAYSDYMRKIILQTITVHISELRLNWSVREGPSGAHYFIKVINPREK